MGRLRALCPAIAAACLLVVAAGCGNDDESTTGRVNLRLTGSVSGTLDKTMNVDCSPPANPGERFIVSFDSDDGASVGGKRLTAMDVATPAYQGPRSYDLKQALASDEQLSENFFLLFKEFEDQPLTWGSAEDSAGSIVIDSGQSSGRLSLRGWTSGTGDLKVNVEGTFRCGQTRPGQGPQRGAG